MYIFNSWNLNCDPWVSWSFLQNNNHQSVKKMKWIENRKNTVKKPLEFCMILYVWLCMGVWVCGHTCVGYSCVLMCFCMGLSEVTNSARYFSRVWIRRCILIFRYIILFLYESMTIAKKQNVFLACRGEWIKIWFVSAFKRIYYGRPESQWV